MGSNSKYVVKDTVHINCVLGSDFTCMEKDYLKKKMLISLYVCEQDAIFIILT